MGPKSMTIPALLLAALLLTACAVPANPAKELRAMSTDPTIQSAAPAEFGCDALFFGDSITADSDFSTFFPQLRIVNLGVYGDTIQDLLRRVDALKTEDPARIFLLVGINSLRPNNVEDCLEHYTGLLDAVKTVCPRAELVVETVLPVAAELDPEGSLNDAVRRFNAGLEELAGERSLELADLYAAYEKDGALDPALTRDGLHLNYTAYGPWADVIEPFLNGD